ncbi:hypothetical protein EVAR_96062_1 [Eumeta japonica]|uniref:Uncharacterized protein n=1 Tax=Eumeta variegata TaxID=151549 RepID=A0A4C1WAD4_EUMVA|nr:hypothetical protein EVAR_96062_1 [Eumeta japonica]
MIHERVLDDMDMGRRECFSTVARRQLKVMVAVACWAGGAAALSVLICYAGGNRSVTSSCRRRHRRRMTRNTPPSTTSITGSWKGGKEEENTPQVRGCGFLLTKKVF